MTEEYYVIVDLETLQYQKNGNGVNLVEADKFDTYEEALQELSNYDDEFEGSVYKVTEYRDFTIKKVRQQV